MFAWPVEGTGHLVLLFGTGDGFCFGDDKINRAVMGLCWYTGYDLEVIGEADQVCSW